MNVALIPMRKGSKGVPGKNTKVIGGKPLALWVIEAAIGCEEIDRVYVCSDDPDVDAVARGLASSKLEIIGRSEESATDTASTETVMLEFAKDHQFDRLVLIQATSPLLTSIDLSSGFAELRRSGADSIFSAVEQNRFIWDRNEAGYGQPRNYSPAQRPRRQEFPAYFVGNGAFYICSRGDLLKTRCRISGKIAIHGMPEESYLELDGPTDWKIVEGILKEREHAQVSLLVTGS